MNAFFSSGRIVDLIVALVGLEAVALLGWKRMRGSGPAVSSLLANLLSGAFLLLALRAALAGSSWVWIAACLLAALFAHCADLVGRLRDASK